MDFVREKLKTLEKNDDANLSKHVFKGKFTHQQTLEMLLDFISVLVNIGNREIVLKNENIKILWNLFMKNSNLESDKQIFLKWVNKKHHCRHRNEKSFIILSEEERKFFFTEILCNPAYVDPYKTTMD